MCQNVPVQTQRNSKLYRECSQKISTDTSTKSKILITLMPMPKIPSKCRQSIPRIVNINTDNAKPTSAWIIIFKKLWQSLPATADSHHDTAVQKSNQVHLAFLTKLQPKTFRCKNIIQNISARKNKKLIRQVKI